MGWIVPVRENFSVNKRVCRKQTIGHVRYINILTWLRGLRVKIVNFLKFLLSLNSQKRLGYKENNTKYRSLTRKPRSHVRILIYRSWPIEIVLRRFCLFSFSNFSFGFHGFHLKKLKLIHLIFELAPGRKFSGEQ